MLIAFGMAGCSFLNEEEETGSITISLGTKGARTAFSEEDVPVDIFEDLDHWFFEGTVYGEDFSVVQITQISETPSITFFEIPSGKTVYIEVLLRYRDDEWNEATFYKGESEPFVVQKGDNFVTVKMKEYEGDGPNPIEMETDDMLFEIGSKLVFKAKSKTGSLIPASDIYFEFHRIGYDAYGPHDDILIPKENNNLETAGDYLLTQSADSYVITTAITNPPDAYE